MSLKRAVRPRILETYIEAEVNLKIITKLEVTW
jgi:hypothetical protein